MAKRKSKRARLREEWNKHLSLTPAGREALASARLDGQTQSEADPVYRPDNTPATVALRRKLAGLVRRWRKMADSHRRTGWPIQAAVLGDLARELAAVLRSKP